MNITPEDEKIFDSIGKETAEALKKEVSI